MLVGSIVAWLVLPSVVWEVCRTLQYLVDLLCEYMAWFGCLFGVQNSPVNGYKTRLSSKKVWVDKIFAVVMKKRSIDNAVFP